MTYVIAQNPPMRIAAKKFRRKAELNITHTKKKKKKLLIIKTCRIVSGVHSIHYFFFLI
jgi:hypothetical protein